MCHSVFPNDRGSLEPLDHGEVRPHLRRFQTIKRRKTETRIIKEIMGFTELKITHQIRTIAAKFSIYAFLILLLTGGDWAVTHAQSAEDLKYSDNHGTFFLTDHTGHAVTDRDFRGSYLLIFFGYTHCPDICPTALTIIGNVMRQLGPKSQKVQPLFITLDPERDSYQVLAEYVAYFHPRLIGLTGNADQIEKVAKTYFVRSQTYVPDTTLDQTTNRADENYLLDHTAAIYLLGTNGNGLALFQHGTPAGEIVDTILRFIARDALLK